MGFSHLIGKEVTVEDAKGLYYGTVAAAAERTVCLKNVYVQRDGWRKTEDKVIDPATVKIQRVKEDNG